MVGMSYNVTDLPKEILDMIFEDLMCPLDGWRFIVCPTDVFKELDVPDDLFRVMAVCKRFHEVALPWAWRVAAISLQGDDPDAEFDSLEGTLLYRGQWEHLRENPQLACHIRLLGLGIFGDDHHASSPDICALRSVVDLMPHLRVLRILNNSKNKAVASILTSLIDKPQLHTIVTSDFSPPEPPSLPRNNLTNLSIKEWHPTYENFIRTSPRLQSLAITAAPDPDPEHRARFVSSLENLPIPWGTLRVLTLKWIDDWRLVQNNLLSWKKLHPDTSAPLSELTIDRKIYTDMSAEDIQYLASCGQDLRALWIGLPEVVEEATLNLLCDAFPNMENLGLLTDGRSLSWGMNLPTVVRCLGKLPNLRSLHWNYIDEEPDKDIDVEDVSEVDGYESEMLDSFRRIVGVVASQCQALEKITFNDEGLGDPEDPRQNRQFLHHFTILRDDHGRYDDYSELKFYLKFMPNLLNKGDWDFCSFEHVL